jgi:DNA topoisomerase IA
MQVWISSFISNWSSWACITFACLFSNGNVQQVALGLVCYRKKIILDLEQGDGVELKADVEAAKEAERSTT